MIEPNRNGNAANPILTEGRTQRQSKGRRRRSVCRAAFDPNALLDHYLLTLLASLRGDVSLFKALLEARTSTSGRVKHLGIDLFLVRAEKTFGGQE